MKKLTKKNLKVGDLLYWDLMNFAFLIENETELTCVRGNLKDFSPLTKEKAKSALKILNEDNKYILLLRKMLNKYLRENR